MKRIKAKLYEVCVNYVEERIRSAEQAINNARESSNDDTKSSAGDKYETGREMMQQEIDRNRKQLEEAKKLRMIMELIDPGKNTNIVQNGSLVSTNQGDFYICISIGQVLIENRNYFAISAVSPIGLKLLKQRAGFVFEFNGKIFEIRSVQ